MEFLSPVPALSIGGSSRDDSDDLEFEDDEDYQSSLIPQLGSSQKVDSLETTPQWLYFDDTSETADSSPWDAGSAREAISEPGRACKTLHGLSLATPKFFEAASPYGSLGVPELYPFPESESLSKTDFLPQPKSPWTAKTARIHRLRPLTKRIYPVQCEFCGKGLSRESDLHLHQTTICSQSPLRQVFRCQTSGCPFSHYRKHEVARHCRLEGHLAPASSTPELLLLKSTSRLSHWMPNAFEIRLFGTLRASVIFSKGQTVSANGLKACVRDLAQQRPQDIKIKSKITVGHLNGFKCLLERLTKQRWQWWPLKPRIFPIERGYRRLTWLSSLGHQQEMDIPDSVMPKLREDLAIMFDPPTHFAGVQRNQATPSSRQTYSMQQLPPQVSARTARQGQSVVPDPIQLPTAGPTNVTTRLHVYVGMEDGKKLRFSDIRTEEPFDDLSFFTTLRNEFIAARGWFWWLNLWQYDHCDFYRFRKTMTGSGTLDKHDYPQPSDDYDMFPCPVIYDPPICDEDFFDFFWHLPHADPPLRPSPRQQRIWALLKGNRCALPLLPKRKKTLPWHCGPQEWFFGLYVVESPNFMMLFMYICFTMMAPTAFFFFWLFYWRHPADLQNASVPLTLWLGYLTVLLILLFDQNEKRMAKTRRVKV